MSGFASLPPAVAPWFKRPGYKWVVIALLFFAGFLNLEDRVVIFSVLPLIRQELQLSDLFVGALMSAFLWTYAVSSPLAGFLGDALSRQRVIVGCLALWSLVTVAAGLATSPAQLMATRILLAVTEAFYIPASMAIVADYHGPATRAKAMAILMVGMNLGPIVGGAAAGWIGDHYGWRPTLLILGGAGVLLAGLLAAFLRDAPAAGDAGAAPGPARRAPFGATVRHVLATPSIPLILLAVGIFSLAVWMLITWLPIFLFETFKLSLTQSGFFGNLAILGPVLLGALLGGVLSDYVGARQPKRRLLLMIAAYGCATPWPWLFSAATGPSMVLASVFFFQLFRMLGELNNHPIFFELVAPEQRSTVVGLANCVNTTFGGMGALVVGRYRESIGFQTVFGLVPVLFVVALLALLIVYFRYLPRDLARRPSPPRPAEENNAQPCGSGASG